MWDETAGRWTVHTDRDDRMRARYVVLANGILTTPKLARIEGMESFKGKTFHTSRWDYTIDLEGKRVGIIGTGATAVQVIPEIAKVVEGALRLPADALDHRRARPARHGRRGDRGLVSRSPAGRGHGASGWPRSRRAAPRCRAMTTSCRARSPASSRAGSMSAS